jgi:hypothetical protein
VSHTQGVRIYNMSTENNILDSDVDSGLQPSGHINERLGGALPPPPSHPLVHHGARQGSGNGGLCAPPFHRAQKHFSVNPVNPRGLLPKPISRKRQFHSSSIAFT